MLRGVLDRLFGSEQEKLYRDFTADPTAFNLARLISASITSAQPLRVNDSVFRSSLAAVAPWPDDPTVLEHLLNQWQSFLISDIGSHSASDWKIFIDLHSQLRRELPIGSSGVISALADALSTAPARGVFTSADRSRIMDLVVRSALRALSAAEGSMTLDSCRAIIVLAGASQHSSREDIQAAIRKWWSNLELRPRNLDSVPDDDAIRAPIRGVGSPNGVAVTMLHVPENSSPVQIVGAGRTPDAVINSWLDDALFAAALSCDSEPTVLSVNGSILSMSPSGSPSARAADTPLLFAVLGPAGPQEPTGKSPALGLTGEESLLLVRETFQKIESTSGLIRTSFWHPQDGRDLEAAVMSAFEAERPRSICSDQSAGEQGAALHGMPLFLRGSKREVRGMSIRVPYHVLGSQRVFNLLRKARTLYVDGLIRDTERRIAMAKDARVQHQTAIDTWNAYSAVQQAAECSRLPEIEVAYEYDFVLGILRPLKPPRRIPRREYEEQVRPRIVAGATEFEQKFTELRAKLSDISKPGGRADYLVMKLLVESAIRLAKLPFSASHFQTEYTQWAEIAGPALWAYIAAWCTQHDFPIADLAEDNVIFNVRVNAKDSVVLIEPWLLVDLHNYAIRVDPIKGYIHAGSGSRPMSLDALLVQAPGIKTIDDLRRYFNSWLAKFPYPLKLDTDSSNGVLPPSDLLDKCRVPILFAFSKALLFAGQWEKARKLLLEIRNADEVAIYFLGALACIVGTGFLNQRPQYAAVASASGARSKAQLECVIAVEILLSGRDMDLLPQECRRFLQQVVAKDPKFLGSLLTATSKVHALASLTIPGESDPAVKYSRAAAASLELFHLAEATYKTAQDLPTDGSLTGDVRRKLGELCALSERLAFTEVPPAARFDDLRKQIA